MAFDLSKLTGLIIEKYGTRKSFAEALGISEASLTYKLNGSSYFKSDEIARATALLGIADDDVSVYFFTRKVK